MQNTLDQIMDDTLNTAPPSAAPRQTGSNGALTEFVPGDDWVESEAMSAALDELANALVGRTDTQGHRIEHPLGSNVAVSFENEVFALRDYCWCEGAIHRPTPQAEEAWDRGPANFFASGGSELACPFNFEHHATGVRGTWYKYRRRNEEFDRPIDEQTARAILADCLASLR